MSSHQRMTRFEYITLWLTFAAIMVRAFQISVYQEPHAFGWRSCNCQCSSCRPQATGLELGIAAGLLLSALFFSFQYARCAHYLLCTHTVFFSRLVLFTSY